MGSGISSRLKKSNVSKSQPEGKVQYAERCSSDEVSALNIVERLWKQIDSQQFKEAFEDKKITKTGWKEIRVFVSSTFSDMHSEREILVKKVFPELRDWCEERRCTLTECDLRWGIPKDTESNTTISVCLEEIDRCYEVNNGTPYFVNMLSERYGWIPSENEVSEEIREKYSWVPNISITHMEILHGAYRTGNPNAFFCLRNPKFVSDLPQQHLNKFMETKALPKLHLEVLKSKLQEKFGDQCITYDCKVSGIDQHTGRDKVKLTGLEDFGQKVLNFLKSAISRQYLDVGMIEELSEGDQGTGDDFLIFVLNKLKIYALKGNEEIIHQRTASLQGSFVVGRSKEFEAVNSYLKESFVSELFVSNADEQEVLRSEAEEYGFNNNKILCISGIPGLGKCSILCDCAGKLMESGSKVLFHCTGCTTGSCDWRSIVKRIIRLDGSEEANEDDEQILLEKMKKVLKKINKCIILFICRLENMYNNESVDCLEWLPARFPANVKCVVSVDSNNYICMNRLEKKECHFLQLENFTLDEASLFVQEYLLKYNKKLDEEQMRSFLSKKSSTFPLWLKVASEELRVFGDFVTLSNKIKSFPDNLKDLIKEVIDRLVREDETSLMGKLLSLMLCSHSGLPESEICKLLGEPMKGVESAPIAWATIRRQLKPFIIEMKFHRTSKVTFMHKAFTEAAKDLMLNEKNSQKWNLYLADYFELCNKDEIYLEDDLAHNLFHAGCWKRLSTFYRTDVRTFSMNALFKSRLLHRIRCKQLIFPQASCKVLICNLCSTKSRLISVLPNMTKDLCYLCGCWVPFKHENDIAKLCLKHRTHFSDNFKKCFHCNQHIMTPNPPHMYLCNFCKFGNHCSYLMEGCND